MTRATSAADRKPPAPVTSAPDAGLRVRAATTSGVGGGRAVVLDVLDVLVVVEEDELDEDEVEEDELDVDELELDELVEEELVEDELEMDELVVDELDVDELEEEELVEEELVVEVLEGSSASPISAQGIASEFKVRGKYVGEDTPLVAYSALPPNVPPLDPGDKVNPAPALVLTRLGSPTILTRKAPV